MTTSNHTWNAGDRPALRITAAGIKLLALMDYVNVHHIVSPDLINADTAVPPEEQLLSEVQRLERELDQALQVLRDLRIARADDEQYNAAYDRVTEIRARIYRLENPDPAPEDRDTEDPIYDDDFDLDEDDDVRCHCGAVLDAFLLCPFCDVQEDF